MSNTRDIVSAFRQVFNRSPRHKDLSGMSYEQGEALKMVSFDNQAFICVDHKEDYEEFIATLKGMPENACFLPDDFGSSANDDLLASFAQKWLMKTAKEGYEDLKKLLLNEPTSEPMTIKTIICDLDGVLTNGHQHLNDEGEKLFKTFHARDKTAIRRAIESGIRVIVVSADDWNGAKEWVSSFNSPLVEFMHRKIKVFDQCVDRIDWSETAGIGDDFIDLPFLEKCRLAYCPKDALSNLYTNLCTMTILDCEGGKGVFAEALIDIEMRIANEPIKAEFRRGIEAMKIVNQQPESHNFIQWKGTDLCMDMWCECGYQNHYDGFFTYAIKCAGCGQVYQLGTKVEMKKVSSSELK